MAKELAVQGVRVNALAPGFIEVSTSRALSSKLGSATVAFLASDESSYFIGATLSPKWRARHHQLERRR